MMKIEDVKAMFDKVKKDVWFDIIEEDEDFGKILIIHVEDFAGFDKDYHEIFRDYDGKAIDKILDKIKKMSEYISEGFGWYYKFEDFAVDVRYASEYI